MMNTDLSKVSLFSRVLPSISLITRLPIRLLLLLTVGTISVHTAHGQVKQPIGLIEFLNARLRSEAVPKERERSISDICPVETDSLAARIFSEYGALYSSTDNVVFPPRCIFQSEDELAQFQRSLKSAKVNIGGIEIELQAAALTSLLEAIKAAKEKHLSITPRGGKTASRRSFDETKRLWDSRFLPGLEHWITRKKITHEEAEIARKASISEQVKQVLAWESKGYFFSTGKDRTILSSVAAPGTSQHLSMLALDVSQYADPRVRQILAQFGWFQTVADDTPHFTFIGVKEDELPKRGLKPLRRNGYTFWVPNV